LVSDGFAKLLHLGKKKEFLFVLLSIFRNSAIKMAKLLALGNKKKNKFSFYISLVFRNFVPKWALSNR